MLEGPRLNCPLRDLERLQARLQVPSLRGTAVLGHPEVVDEGEGALLMVQDEVYYQIDEAVLHQLSFLDHSHLVPLLLQSQSKLLLQFKSGLPVVSLVEAADLVKVKAEDLVVAVQMQLVTRQLTLPTKTKS